MNCFLAFRHAEVYVVLLSTTGSCSTHDLVQHQVPVVFSLNHCSQGLMAEGDIVVFSRHQTFPARLRPFFFSHLRSFAPAWACIRNYGLQSNTMVYFPCRPCTLSTAISFTAVLIVCVVHVSQRKGTRQRLYLQIYYYLYILIHIPCLSLRVRTPSPLYWTTILVPTSYVNFVLGFYSCPR